MDAAASARSPAASLAGLAERDRPKSRRFTVHDSALPPRLSPTGAALPPLPPNSGIVRLASPRNGSPIANRPKRSLSALPSQSRRGSILDAPVNFEPPPRPVPASPRVKPQTSAANEDEAGVNAEPLHWDAHVFRLKRREAQLAIENLPKYAALVRAELLRNASKQAADLADAKLKEQLLLLDEELFAQSQLLLAQRVRARAFEIWRAFARSMRKKLNAPPTRGLHKPPSFSQSFENLVQQKGTRLEARGSFRKFARSADVVSSRESSSQPGPTTLDSSSALVPAPSTASSEDLQQSPVFPANSFPGEEDEDDSKPAKTDSAPSVGAPDLGRPAHAPSSDGMAGIGNLYVAAVVEEERRARRPKSLIGRVLAKLL